MLTVDDDPCSAISLATAVIQHGLLAAFGGLSIQSAIQPVYPLVERGYGLCSQRGLLKFSGRYGPPKAPRICWMVVAVYENEIQIMNHRYAPCGIVRITQQRPAGAGLKRPDRYLRTDANRAFW